MRILLALVLAVLSSCLYCGAAFMSPIISPHVPPSRATSALREPTALAVVHDTLDVAQTGKVVTDTYFSFLHNPLFVGLSVLSPLLPEGAKTAVRAFPTPGRIVLKGVQVARNATSTALNSTSLADASGEATPLAKAVPEEPPLEAIEYVKLVVCILIDLGGDASLILPPPLGFLKGLVYGPFEALVVAKLFQSPFLAGLALGEEVLPIPFIDIIPTATFGWVLQTYYPGSWLGKRLGLKSREEKAEEEAAAKAAKEKDKEDAKSWWGGMGK